METRDIAHFKIPKSEINIHYSRKRNIEYPMGRAGAKKEYRKERRGDAKLRKERAANIQYPMEQTTAGTRDIAHFKIPKSEINIHYFITGYRQP